MNYEELSRQANAVNNRTAYINSLSLGEEQGRNAGGRRNVEASIVGHSIQRAGEAEQRNKAEQRNEQELGIKNYAEEVGIYISSLRIDKSQFVTSNKNFT
jgi:hypothetical protein